jgi:hypothetical protein
MELLRIYRGPDTEMISQVHGIYSFFDKHLADFTVYDPRFNNTYLANFLQAYKNAGMLALGENDESETVADGFLIDDSNNALMLCRQKYADVKYYAAKAFPGNKAILREFGQGAYSKVCTSRLRMVQFMETLHGVATKYKTQLIAADYTQAGIDKIATLTTQLRNANQAQQLQKTQRPTETRERIEALNTFYTMGKQVRDAGKVVYRHSPVHMNSLRLGVRHHPPVTKVWVNIGASSTRKIVLTKLLKKFGVTLTNQSKETLHYWQANKITDTPSQKWELSAGEIISIESETPAKKFLLLQNTSGKAVRVMITKTTSPKSSPK